MPEGDAPRLLAGGQIRDLFVALEVSLMLHLKARKKKITTVALKETCQSWKVFSRLNLF